MHEREAIAGFEGSYALRATSGEVDTAVVFVHGFLGDAYGTWVDFQRRVELDPWWERADLFFLQYDSFGDSIATSGARVLELVDSVLRSRRRTVGEDYRQLLLVGHSQGGLVLRQAIRSCAKRHAEALEEPRLGVEVPPALHARLRLFAPALLGARPAGALGFILGSVGVGPALRALAGMSKAYNEMRQGSELLTVVREATEKLAARFALPAFRAEVVWAADDNVVIDTEYDCDYERGRPPGTTHTSVCKPGPGYGLPIRFARSGRTEPS